MTIFLYSDNWNEKYYKRALNEQINGSFEFYIQFVVFSIPLSVISGLMIVDTLSLFNRFCNCDIGITIKVKNFIRFAMRRRRRKI